MVWSLSPFLSEIDVLEIRLAELDPVVDVFVIAEATRTHTNEPRDLVFPQHSLRFSRWLHKIRYLKMSFPELPGHWERENYQREALGRGLEGLGQDDIVIISDVDEILRADTVRKIAAGDFRLPCTFSFPIHPYRLDWKWESIDEGCERCTVVQKDHLEKLSNGFYRGVQAAIGFSFCCFTDPAYQGPRPSRLCLGHTHYLGEYGWHFTYQGDEEQIISKTNSIADEWVKGLATEEDAREAISQGRDLFGRADKVARRVGLSELPLYVQEHPERFSRLLGAPVAASL